MQAIVVQHLNLETFLSERLHLKLPFQQTSSGQNRGKRLYQRMRCAKGTMHRSEISKQISDHEECSSSVPAQAVHFAAHRRLL